ncbi:hypothetical protein K6V78_01985 [Streptococcus gallolyticus]|nr:hypothetical protein [Streptococcus gallolyticus]MBY5040408.1 hypothetical protein [Streptococcus gallolyticus]
MKTQKLFLYSLCPLVVHFLPVFLYLFVTMKWLDVNELALKSFDISTILFYAPLAIFLVSTLFGFFQGFNWYFPLVIGGGFLLKIVVEYACFNSDGIEFYLLPYLIISFLAMLLGVGLGRMSKKGKKKT